MLFIKKHSVALFSLLLGICFYFMLPSPLFKSNFSLVLLDENNDLLQAQIANDGQWRFPASDSVPEKLAYCPQSQFAIVAMAGSRHNERPSEFPCI
jgi:penicillin-binding protein 1C